MIYVTKFRGRRLFKHFKNKQSYFIEEIPIFNDDNSNQQFRFITLVDILYEKILLSLSLADDLKNLGSSKKHFKIFKRTTSRLIELTKKN